LIFINDILCDIKEAYLSRIWGSHSGGYEECYLLGYNSMQSVALLATYSTLVSCLAHSSILKMDVYVLPTRWLTFSDLHDIISQAYYEAADHSPPSSANTISPQSPSPIIWGWYNRPVVAAVPGDSVLPH
jgi:hypothetical protein